jgi:FkbM family methyltransferase
MNKLFLRINNKLNRIRGAIACRWFQEYRQNPGWLIRNAFMVGDGVADIQYRAHDTGDWGAVHQVFHCLDYRVDFWSQGKALVQFYEENAKERTPLIIDAGANIGTSCVYFSTMYPKSLVVAIEPEKNNCNLLRLNCQNRLIEVHEAAIGNKPGKLFLKDPGLSSWGFRVGEQGDYAVNVITVDQILEGTAKNAVPFILKIDIEGGEQSLFDAECSWLAKFPLVVIELHDWMLPGSGSSNNFLKKLSSHNFDILHRGENLFCFNNAMLGRYY